ncbi:hypothetical protein ACSQ67_011601 [Phaseolus vulgaris]
MKVVVEKESTEAANETDGLGLLSASDKNFSGKQHCGPNNIFTSLSSIRATLVGECPPEKLVHVVEKLQCRAHGEDGVAPF